MPGVYFSTDYFGGSLNPIMQRFPVACGLTGSDTQGTSGAGCGAMYVGDWAVLTSNTTWGTSPLNGVNVLSVRKLTYADLITNSLGNGILGACTENFTTDVNGRYSAVPTYGSTTTPVPFAVPNPSALWMQDKYSLRNEIPIIIAGRSNGFKARIVPTYTSAMGQGLNNTQAGFSIITGLSAPIAVQGNVTTAGSLGTLATGWYSVIFTYVNQDSQSNVYGETLGSTTPFAVNCTSNGLTLVATGVLASTAFTNIAKYYKTYVAGPYTSQALALAAPLTAYYLQNGATSTVYTATGTNLVISAPISTTTANPPTFNSTGMPGVSQYFIDPGASTKFIRILEVNTSDPLYGSTFAAGNLNPGPETAFTVNIANCQVDPGNTLAAYTT